MQKITVKITLVIFGVIEDTLHVYLRDSVLPSEELISNISLEDQVETLFSKTTGVSLGEHYYEQLYTVTNETSEVAIVYFVLLPLENTSYKFDAAWTKISSLRKNAQDKEIITYAVQRLQWKVEYTNVVYSLLPREFTLSELQKTYEAILGQILDKRNFRKKILSLKFLEPTRKKRFGVSRPAQMYTFKERSPIFVKIFS